MPPHTRPTPRVTWHARAPTPAPPPPMSNPLLDADLDTPGGLTIREQIERRIRRRLDISDDAAYEGQTLENVRAGIKFQGANLWILMLAILICSIGLNVNSTAVIIGAMLISPLMGPILGVGCGAAISDSDLLLTSLKNLGIATLASMAVSAAYFAVTPLSGAQSELLARTAPTLFDVLIATFGGFVGIIALTRRSASNAIPGVAIATALMPPICTAGYSLATGEWKYLAGSLYPYFINLTFIAFATFVLVRLLKFKQYKFVDEASEKRTKRWIYVVAALMAAPSFYTAYSTVQGSVLENRVARFVEGEFGDMDGTQVIGREVADFKSEGGPKITLLLLGKTMDEADIEVRRERLREYALDGFELEIVQDEDLTDRARIAETDASQVDFEALYREADRQVATDREQMRELRRRLSAFTIDSLALSKITAESRALYPEIEAVRLARFNSLTGGRDTSRFVAHLQCAVPLSQKQTERYGEWLRTRQSWGSVMVVQ